tara:strand:+ start:492 stop:641 length:150 start_codon:yes stop_codon:yes gene_type:complete
MKKYIWFIVGYFTALATIFLASCTYAPLEAGGSELGSTSWNPVYVKIVD